MNAYFLINITCLTISFFCLGCSKQVNLDKPQVEEIVLVGIPNTKVIKKIFRIDDIVVQTVVFSNGVPNGEIIYYSKYIPETILCKGLFVNGKPCSGKFILGHDFEIVLDGVIPFYAFDSPVFAEYKSGKRVKVE